MEIRPLRTVICKEAKEFSCLRPRLPSKRQLQTDLVRKLFPLLFLQTLCSNERLGSRTPAPVRSSSYQALRFSLTGL